MSWKSHLITILVVTVFAQIISAAPQFLTFQDGKFGVNFGGYHAEAGLGGLLTGNAAHGGLSASAGTPHGQQAGAGIGGIASGNDRTAGGAYAGATAGNGVGASAAIGGGIGGEGGAGGVGAEAHAAGASKKVVRLGQTNGPAPASETVLISENSPALDQNVNTRFNQEIGGKSKTKTKTIVKEIQSDVAVHQPTYTRTKTIYKKKIIGRPHKGAIGCIDPCFDSGTAVYNSNTNNGFDLSRFFDFQAFTNLASTYSHPPVRPAVTSVSSTTHVEHKDHQDTELHKEVTTVVSSKKKDVQTGTKTNPAVTTVISTGHVENKNKDSDTELDKEVSKDEDSNEKDENDSKPKPAVTSVTSTTHVEQTNRHETELDKEVTTDTNSNKKDVQSETNVYNTNTKKGVDRKPTVQTAVTSVASTDHVDCKDHRHIELHKEVHLNTRLDSSAQSSGSAHTTTTVTGSSTHGSNFWNDIFNIPIATLSAVNQFLNNKAGSGSIQVHKHTEVVH